MKFTPLAIPDVILIEPRIFEDARGIFCENYNRAIFATNGIKDDFVQDNHSRSALGVLRGLHYQVEPKAQAKLMRVTRGSVFDVAVDIRKNSKTFGKHVSTILNAENRRMLYVPKGFAHGFCVLEDKTELLYKVSDFYSPEQERGLIWNDPLLAIDWPKPGREFLLSEKDKKYPTLKETFKL